MIALALVHVAQSVYGMAAIHAYTAAAVATQGDAFAWATSRFNVLSLALKSATVTAGYWRSAGSRIACHGRCVGFSVSFDTFSLGFTVGDRFALMYSHKIDVSLPPR
jgi:hypothetical protein